MRKVDFQKCIPVSGYKDIYFDKVRCFPYIFYLSQVIKIYILMRKVDFQKCIPVSVYKDIYFDKVR